MKIDPKLIKKLASRIRKIDYCELSEKIADDPERSISDFLPGKTMFRTIEFLVYKQHVDKCDACNKQYDRIEASMPKPQWGDNIKNEN